MWHWKIRIYNRAGDYAFAQIATGQDLKEIDNIQDFYFTLTGCKMLLEGMSEHPYENIPVIGNAYDALWVLPNRHNK